MKFVRSGNYANVTATLALVLALGGTSYAAIDVANNSVDSESIKDNTIKSEDVKDNTIKSEDVKDNTLKSADVKDNTLKSKDVKDGKLLAKDFKAGQLPAGPQVRSVQSVRSARAPATRRTNELHPVERHSRPAGEVAEPPRRELRVVRQGAGEQQRRCQRLRAVHAQPRRVVDDNGGDGLILLPNVSADRGTFSLLGAATIAAPGTASLTSTTPNNNGAWSGATISPLSGGQPRLSHPGTGCGRRVAADRT